MNRRAADIACLLYWGILIGLWLALANEQEHHPGSRELFFHWAGVAMLLAIGWVLKPQRERWTGGRWSKR